MKRRAISVVAVIALLGTIAAPMVPAAAEGKSFSLMGLKDSPEASGMALLDGTHFSLTVSGLKPKAVYSVWFVNMQPAMAKEGVGTAPYAFTTDAKGQAKYDVTLTQSPLGKWQSIMIVRHPSGDPKDMNQMADALMAKLM